MRPEALVELLVEHVAGVVRPHPVRVAIDGPDAAGKTTLADALVAPLRLLGRPVVRVSADDFHQPRSIRYRQGRDDPHGRYEDAINHAALRREVLDPLGPGGSGRYLPTLWDLAADRATRAAYRTAPPDAVLVVDGLYLLRPELAGAFDVAVHVEVSDATVLRRALARDVPALGTPEQVTRSYRARYLPARHLYEAVARPRDRAQLVVRNDDPRHPALVVNTVPA